MGTHPLTIRARENFDILVEAEYFPTHKHLMVCGVYGELFRRDVRRPAKPPQRCDCLRVRDEDTWRGFDYNEFTRLCLCCGRVVLKIRATSRFVDGFEGMISRVECLFDWGHDRVFRNLRSIRFRGPSMTLRSYLIATGRAEAAEPDLGRETALVGLLGRFGAQVTSSDLESFREKFRSRQRRCDEAADRRSLEEREASVAGEAE